MVGPRTLLHLNNQCLSSSLKCYTLALVSISSHSSILNSHYTNSSTIPKALTIFFLCKHFKICQKIMKLIMLNSISSSNSSRKLASSIQFLPTLVFLYLLLLSLGVATSTSLPPSGTLTHSRFIIYFC